VIRTKVPVTVQEFGHDRYCLLGPLSYKSAQLEVEEQQPENEALRQSMEAMRQQGQISAYFINSFQISSFPSNRANSSKIRYFHLNIVLFFLFLGIKLLYGRWLIESSPNVLLFDTASAFHRLNEWQGDLWKVAGIPCPSQDFEMNESIIFGYLVAWFLGEVYTLTLFDFHELLPHRCLY
jgi:glycogen(starch) synthase